MVEAGNSRFPGICSDTGFYILHLIKTLPINQVTTTKSTKNATMSKLLQSSIVKS